MQPTIRQRLIALESRDAVAAYHLALYDRELSARRAKEITSAAKQASEFLRNSAQSNDSVRPLLSFYGVASLSRAVALLMRRSGGEETLARGHGLETVRWPKVLSGDIPAGLTALGSLRLKISSGLFMDLVQGTDHYMCMHVWSSAVDWGLSYGVPTPGEELSLGELLARVPDLQAEHLRASQTIEYTPVKSMTYSGEQGLLAIVGAPFFENFKSSYIDAGYEATRKGSTYDLKCTADVFSRSKPQYMHTYVNKTFGSIPGLYIVKPFANATRYSQMACTYALSYCLGMLSRYFPTHWMSLLGGERGDAPWPAINAAQKYIDDTFPELIVEYIHHQVAQATKNSEKPTEGAAEPH